MTICYTAVKPSGDITLGNYFGTIRNWRDLSHQYQCFFCVADLHALTVQQDPAAFNQRILSFMAFYYACGLNPESTVLYLQSQVPEHAELHWLLTNLTHMGELGRMTQYKDKSQGLKEQAISAGLFNYPILMAADIALYKTNVVPVGEDQKQHLELCREIINRLNHRFGLNWPVPEPMISDGFGRLMGLQTPEKKMSKSEGGENNVIFFTDDLQRIRKKIMRAVTDSGTTIEFDPVNRPGVSNLVNLYALLNNQTNEQVCQDYEGQGYGVFKKALADLVVDMIAPVQEKMHLYMQDPAELMRFCQKGKEKARAIATKNLDEIKSSMGLVI